MTTVRVNGFITSVVEICWNISVLFSLLWSICTNILLNLHPILWGLELEMHRVEYKEPQIIPDHQ